MPLSCDYEDDVFDYYADPDENFSTAKQDCKCESCGKKIKAGETVVRFHCWRPADPDSGNPEDIQADEDGDDVHLPDEFHCERCGEIYLNLHEIGYCLCISEHMPSLLKEYQKMIGFDPEKYEV